MQTCLGIDYGLERTGIAIAYDSVILPVTTLRLADFGCRKALLDRLANLALEKKTDALVMGLPLLEDGSETATTRIIRNAARRIGRRLPDIPLYFMPEAFTSQEARLQLRDLHIGGIKTILDQVAACNILASFIADPLNKSSP